MKLRVLKESGYIFFRYGNQNIEIVNVIERHRDAAGLFGVESIN